MMHLQGFTTTIKQVIPTGKDVFIADKVILNTEVITKDVTLGNTGTDAFVITSEDPVTITTVTIITTEIPTSVVIVPEIIDPNVCVLTVTITPTLIEQLTFFIDLEITTSESTFTKRVFIICNPLVTGTAIEVTPSTINFGDILDDISRTESFLVTPKASGFRPSLVSYKMLPENDLDALDYAIKEVPTAVDTYGVTYEVTYTPKYNTSATVDVEILYDGKPTGVLVNVSGSSSTVTTVPLNFEVTEELYERMTVSVITGSSPADLYIVVTNNDVSHFRMDVCNISNNAGEFTFANPSLLLGNVIPPNTSLLVPITYTPVGNTYKVPEVVVDGVFF